MSHWLRRSRMFIDPTMNPRPALQRSAMFPAMVPDTALRFAPPGARRNLLEVARSINITSLRDQGNRLENLVKTNKKLDLCITEVARRLNVIPIASNGCQDFWDPLKGLNTILGQLSYPFRVMNHCLDRLPRVLPWAGIIQCVRRKRSTSHTGSTALLLYQRRFW